MAALEDNPDGGPRIYLDRPILPNQSLSRRGMYVVLGVLAVFNGLTTLFLLAIHAYPVPFFLGLDLVGVGVAFAVIDHRRKTRFEQIRVSSDAVEVLRRHGGVPRSVWSTPPAFTRVELDQADEDCPRLTLNSSGRAVSIAMHMGGDGRAHLADEIRLAIAAARNERYLDEA